MTDFHIQDGLIESLVPGRLVGNLSTGAGCKPCGMIHTRGLMPLTNTNAVTEVNRPKCGRTRNRVIEGMLLTHSCGLQRARVQNSRQLIVRTQGGE